MKKNIFLFIYLVSILSFSQEKPELFIGEIYTTQSMVYEDRESYMKSVDDYMLVLDSVATVEYLNSKQKQTLEDYKEQTKFGYKIALDPNFSGSGWDKTSVYKHTITDSLVRIDIPMRSKMIIEKHNFNIKGRKEFNKDFVEVPVKYRFNEVPIEELIIDKTDTRIIAGIECYKVKVVQKGERIVRHFYWNYIKEARVITEMYVTDKISTYFNTIIKNKPILNKFYPMYIKRYSTAFKGFYLMSEVTKVNFNEFSKN